MTWTAFRTRGEILRTVVDELDLRRDGVLPWHLPGVPETFRDELDLVAALHLRWYTQLSGRIDRQLTNQPMDLELAVRRAWVAAAEDLPGVRAVLDRQLAEPAYPEIAATLTKAVANEHGMLALMAGLAGVADRHDPRAIASGARIEAAARAEYRPDAPASAEPDPDAAPGAPSVTGSSTFVARLKAALAA